MPESRRIPGVYDVKTIPYMPSEREHHEIEALLKALPDLVFSLDSKGRVTQANQAALTTLALPPEEGRGVALASLVKGFSIFEWQNSNWKRNGGPDNTESTFGIHAYGPVLCQSKTGVFGMWNAKDSYWVSFHDDVTYDVDALVPLTSAGHPEGLLKALSTYFK